MDTVVGVVDKPGREDSVLGSSNDLLARQLLVEEDSSTGTPELYQAKKWSLNTGAHFGILPDTSDFTQPSRLSSGIDECSLQSPTIHWHTT